MWKRKLSLPVWDELEPSATEPESFEPQEALDIMDETADEFADEESEEAAATSEPAGERSGGEEGTTEEPRSRRRRRRRGRGRGREDAPSAETSDIYRARRRQSEDQAEPDDDEAVVAEGWSRTPSDAAKEPAEEDRDQRASGRSGAGVVAAVAADAIGTAIRFATSEPVGEAGAVDDDEFDFGSDQEEGPRRKIRRCRGRDEHETNDDDERATSTMKTTSTISTAMKNTMMRTAANRRASVSATFPPGKTPSA